MGSQQYMRRGEQEKLEKQDGHFFNIYCVLSMTCLLNCIEAIVSFIWYPSLPRLWVDSKLLGQNRPLGAKGLKPEY